MVGRAIFEAARRTPDKAAVVYNGHAIAYADFAGLIAGAAGSFAAAGLQGPGVVVLLQDNVLGFWIASLALRSLGLTTLAARSPADIAGARLTGIRCVARSAGNDWPELAGICADAGWPIVDIPRDFRTAPLDSVPDRPPGGHILQTSGTTGAFKMVLMDPAFEDAFLRRRQTVFGIGPDSVVGVFDFGGWTGVGYKGAACTWLAGGAVVIWQGGDRFRALNHPGLTHLHIIPQILAMVLSAPGDAFARSETLRLSVAAGAITEAQAQAARERITPLLFSSLGSTETMTFAFTRLETPEDRRWHQVTPGRGVEIVDENDRPLPPGEEGRIRVSTAGGPTGYLQDAEATRAFFRDGWFYPGDLGVLREDGRLSLRGRVTDVINVMGNKIAPYAIEDRLQERLGVSGVCLFSMQNADAEEEAHVVVESVSPVEPDLLASALRESLHGFPRAQVHYVAALPRNEMGKVMRQAARALFQPRREDAE